MESKSIIDKIIDNKFIDDGTGDSWGIGLTLTEQLNPDIFSFDPNLHVAVIAVQNKIPQLGKDIPLPQIIINYKENSWELKLEYYNNNAELDDNLSITLNISVTDVNTLLNNLLKSGTHIYDVNGDDII